jgi:hypothetical protein
MQDEEEFALKAVLVAGYTLLDIFNYLWDPPILRKLFDILNWHTHPLLSFFMLYMYSYLALIAHPWQFPFLILIMITTVGAAAARDRNFDDVRVYANATNTQSTTTTTVTVDGKETEQVHTDSGPVDEGTGKTYTEMYKEMKATALTMEKSVSIWLWSLQCV